MAKKVISSTDVEDQRVLMRVDFNVPLEGGRITDDRRVVQALESIRSVIDRGGKLILMSHLGRPKGQQVAELSLRPIADHLANLVKCPVSFAEDCIGEKAAEAAASLPAGGILLLENLRFHAAETRIDQAKKNPDKKPTADQQAEIDRFAEALCTHADVYCNNAFGTCHRRHVSMYDVPRLIGAGHRVCGHLVQKELHFLGEALSNPRRPFVAILGGAKVSDKIGVIENLLSKVDFILIGGAMSYTFLAAEGIDVGDSLCERDKLDMAADLLKKSEGRIRIPTDSVCAESLKAHAATTTVTGNMKSPLKGLDIGPDTIRDYTEIIRDARTIVWNGPMGVFEIPPFDRGTLSIAGALADATSRGATTIIGGGDSAAAIHATGMDGQMSHISTGGGASLEYLEGKSFESIDLLDDA